MNPWYLYLSALALGSGLWSLAFPGRSRRTLEKWSLQWPPWAFKTPSPRQVTVEHYARTAGSLLLGAVLLWMGLADWKAPDDWLPLLGWTLLYGTIGTGLLVGGILRFEKSEEYGQRDEERFAGNWQERVWDIDYESRAFWSGIVMMIIGPCFLFAALVSAVRLFS